MGVAPVSAMSGAIARYLQKSLERGSEKVLCVEWTFRRGKSVSARSSGGGQ